MSDQVEQNKAKFTRFQLEVIAKGDTTNLAEFMEPGFVTHRTGLDGLGEVLGHAPRTEPLIVPDLDTFGMMLQGAFGGFENHQRRIDKIGGEGDIVWATWTISGTVNGSFHGLEGDGQELEFTEFGWIRFNDEGRMVEGWFASDVGPLLAQLGATVELPAPS